MGTNSNNRTARYPASVAGLLLLAFALSACGGGGSASPKHSGGSSQIPPTGSSTTTSSSAGSQIGASGRASAANGSAAFRVKGGDNSIPNYGSESTSAQRNAAAAALIAYLRDRIHGNWSGACAHLAASVNTQFDVLARASKGKVGGCAGILAALEAHAPPVARAVLPSHSVTALRLKRNSGFALFVGPHHQKYVMPMRREGGTWKVDQLAPIPYPPGSQATSSTNAP